MKKSAHLFLIMFLAFQPIFAFNSNGGNEITERLKSMAREGYFQNDEKIFMELSALCDRILAKEKENAAAGYYKAYSNYRIVSIAMVKQNDTMFDLYYPVAEEAANLSSENVDFAAEAKTVLAANYMMILAKDLSEAASISMKIHTLLGEAEVLNPANPRVNLIRGTMLLNTPPAFGGSAAAALSEYEKALEKFDAQDSASNVNWGYAETLAWIGIANMKNGDLESAELAFLDALNAEPEFGWVKYQLLPTVQSKLKGVEK
ncbi:MAG: hypothetical protein K9J12_02890 [Melioribacteraceae bacterium]|nr:hypothetical protein [Melioribacteraceae bacterium]MCF8263325.1 hypothetical protein [Melioribacteraceae bacterium]MCF8431979.1 hypothetical protein [Melioribacteraceae bacterium]